MQLKSKNVLVTGGLGFIGSHLVDKLIGIGSNITILDRCSKHRWSLERYLNEDINIIIGDIKNKNNVWDAIQDIDVVFHLAAQPFVPLSIRKPRYTIRTNILGTENLLESSIEEDIEKFVYMSSCEVYGHHNGLINEDSSLDANSPYSYSKLACDRMVHCFHKTYDLPMVIIRPFNIYGPRDLNKSRVIPATIMRLLCGSPTSPIIEGDGLQVRDLNFVTDIVNGMMDISIDESYIGKVVNLGSGEGYTISEIVWKIIELLNMRIEPNYVKERQDKCYKMMCDTSNSLYKPKVGLEEGLKLTINWFEDNKKLWGNLIK